MIEGGDPIWTLIVSYFMQKHTDDYGMTSNDRGKDRRLTRPVPIGLTIGPLTREGVSVRDGGYGYVPSAHQHSHVINCREPGCPGRGSQRQSGRVQGGHGGVEGCTKTASEED